VIVTVEEQDLAAWGWPTPDARLADILAAVNAAGPAVIGLDIYRDAAVGDGADRLNGAFRRTNTIGITKLGPEGGLTVRPPEALRESAAYGFSDIPVDRDGVVRRALLLVNDAEGLQMSFALKLAMSKLGQTGIRAWAEDPRVMVLGEAPLVPIGSRFGGYRRVDAAGYQIPLRFAHALPVARSIPARDLIGQAPNSLLKDKVVIIGLNSDSIKDYFRTPLNAGQGARFTYGSQVHAAAVQQLLDLARGDRAMLRDLPRVAQLALVLLAAVAGAATGRITRSGAALALLMPAALMTLLVALDAALERGLWLPAVPILLAMASGFLICFSVLALSARRQRKIMETLFSDHLSPDLAAQIWQSRDLFLSGGKPRPQRLDATVIFVDIAGSTAVGGTTDPAAFVAWISRILDALSDVGRAHGGFIEKFTGDGLLIAFGAPLKRDSAKEIAADAVAACRCAWALGACVSALNAQAIDGPPYRVRIGLHSGPVFGGVLGNRGSLRYNLVGDTVNVASRIEAFGKRLKDRQKPDALICLSGTSLDLAAGHVTAEPLGTLEHDDGATRIEVFRMKAVR
jgi:adenylate cyclase